jgi:2-oxoglutarate ferredoxin oxidoreductase subunit gamma
MIDKESIFNPEKYEWQLILAGEGGQGLVFIGALLGEAAVLDGKQASQMASYTIASRGGFTKAEVVVSNEEITFPGVTEPDLVLALSSEALARYQGSLSTRSILVYDSCLNGVRENDSKSVPLPFSKAVHDAAKKGDRISLNLVALGAIQGLLNIVSPQALQKALLERFPLEEVVNLSLKAFQIGIDLANQYKKK